MKGNQIKFISVAVVIILFLLSRFFFVGKPSGRSYQRSGQRNDRIKEHSPDNSFTNISYADDLNRNSTHIIYSRHARCRMECRHIDEREIRQILATGIVNTRKIETDARGKTYPLEGVVNGHHLRVVFANKGANAVEVVTCIDLAVEWQCDCR